MAVRGLEDFHVLAINRPGQLEYITSMDETYTLPILQDTEAADVFGLWSAGNYEVYITDRRGEVDFFFVEAIGDPGHAFLPADHYLDYDALVDALMTYIAEPGCFDDRDCDGNQICNADGECLLECIGDSTDDCPAERPNCHLDLNRCVECAGPEHCLETEVCSPDWECVECYEQPTDVCPGDRPYCHVGDQRCVECLMTVDCAVGTCVEFDCVECTEEPTEQCSEELPHCLVEEARCVACLVPGDCGEGQVCTNYTCVPDAVLELELVDQNPESESFGETVSLGEHLGEVVLIFFAGLS